MAEDGDARRLDRADEAGRLITRAAQVRVDRCDDRVQLRNGSRRHVERAVLGDVRLGSHEHRERLRARIQRVHVAALRAEVGREKPAGDGTVARVVRQEGVRVAARLERPVESRERHPPVRTVGVEVRVPAQVRVRGAAGHREDAVHVRPREKVGLAVRGGVGAVEHRGEGVADVLVRPAGEERRDRVGRAGRHAGQGGDGEAAAEEVDPELAERPCRRAVLGGAAAHGVLRGREGEERGREPGVRHGRGRGKRRCG